jgi:hypothetical protein
VIRRFWIALACLISVIAGYQGYARVSGVIAWFDRALPGGLGVARPDAVGYIGATFGLALGLTMLFVLVFVVIASIDWLRTRRVLAGVGALRENQQGGQHPDHRRFLEAFGDDEELVHIAADYAATLHEESREAFGGRTRVRLRATVPAVTFFDGHALVDTRLLARFFHRLPVVLCGIGGLGLAFGMLSSLSWLLADEATEGSGATLAPLLEGAQGGLMALFIGVAFAVAVSLAHHAVAAIRHQQVSELCQMIDGLFAPGIETEYLHTLATEMRKGSEETRRVVSGLSSDLAAELSSDSARLSEALEKQNKEIAGAISVAVHEALAGPMKAIAEATKQANRNQAEQVRELVTATLNAFTIELESRFGDQLTTVNGVLSESAAAAAELRQTFAAATDHLSGALSQQAEAFATQLNGALAASSARHGEDNKELATQIGKLSATLSRDVEKHSRRFDNLLKSAIGKVDQIANSSATTSSETLAKTAAVFDGLHSVVENLVTSVTPILSRIVETQEQLLTTMPGKVPSGRLVSKAAPAVSSATKASRKTVEKLVVLGKALGDSSLAVTGAPARPAELRQVAGAGANAGTGNPSRGPARRKKRTGAGLSRALSDLREQSESAAKELPEL